MIMTGSPKREKLPLFLEGIGIQKIFLENVRIIISFSYFILIFLTDHINKFQNKLTPLPGTQVRIEKEYNEDIQLYDDYIKETSNKKDKDLQFKLQIKQQSVELQTRVYFDTILGEPIRETEKVLAEREKILDFTKDPYWNNSDSEIKKFLKNVELGRAHYIGYAVSHGYESIDYQDPDTGNTAMHNACRLGLVNVVEELLKYNACPDIKNKLGNYPIHECWRFWKTENLYRTKEERLEDEKKTCQILVTIFSYGGFVDACDLNGQTPLHIAARLGPTKAVKIILTFQADWNLTTTKPMKLLPKEIAKEFHQNESYKLLNSWENIRNTFIHTDFHIVWHGFLKDYQAIMNNSKSSSTILAELELSNNARHMGRDNRTGEDVLIDDPLLQAAFIASRNERNSLPPKPWEKGWKRYVKSFPIVTKASKLENRLDQLKGKITIDENKNMKMKLKEPTAVEIRREMLPDRPTPLTWKERYENQPILEVEEEGNNEEVAGEKKIEQIEQEGTPSSAKKKDDFEVTLVDSFFGIKKESEKTIRPYERSNINRRRINFAHRIALDGKFLPFTKQLSHESALALPLRTSKAPLEGTEEEKDPMRYILSQGIEFEKLQKYKQTNRLHNILGIKEKPEKSTIGSYSTEVALNKMIERDVLFEKLHNIQGIMNSINSGSLSSPKESEKPSSSSFSSASSVSSIGGGGASSLKSQQPLIPLPPVASTSSASSLLSSSTMKSVKVEVEKKQKIDLVNETRPRYVSSLLLPQQRIVTHLDELIIEQNIKNEQNLLKKLRLGNSHDIENARNQIENVILHEQQLSNSENGILGIVDDDPSLTSTEKALERAKLLGDNSGNPFKVAAKLENDRQQALQRLFLNKQKVNYGEGRLLSSHNLKGKLEEPWITVDGSYLIHSGDRTF
jgi:hypothetical protein